MLARLDSLYPIQTDRLEEMFRQAAERDPLGHRLHLAFGMLWCFLATFPTSIVEIGGIPLLVIFFLRLPKIWRLVLTAMAQPVFVLLFLWASWQFITLLWSPSPWQGFEDIGAARFAWSLPALWPVIRHRRALILAFAAGFVLGHITQVVHGVGVAMEIDWMQWDRKPHRNPGWWRPVISGSILVGALGMHLPAALMGRGGWRWLGVGGVVMTLMGIIATGTRGAWVAGAGLLVVGMGIAAVRLWRGGRSLYPLGAIVAAAALTAGVAWLTIGESIERRARLGVKEVVRALEEKRFRSDTGARLLLMWWGVEAFAERPLGGVGAGGYSAWVRGHLVEQGIDPKKRSIHAHPHNAVLQIAATTGAVGLLLAGAVSVVALRGAFMGLGERGWEVGYDAGPGFALIGYALVGMFDPVHLNMQTSAHLMILLTLSMWPRPGAVGS